MTCVSSRSTLSRVSRGLQDRQPLLTAAGQRKRWTTSSAVNKREPVLTRDFIHRALYSPTEGYFGRKGSDIIISPPEDQRIRFKTLRGYWDYQLELDRLYRSKNEAWLTPVEIFNPYYSNAIARFILEVYERQTRGLRWAGKHRGDRRVRRDNGGKGDLIIYEIGGGYGTNALCILDYIKSHAPDVYARTRYTIIEISRPLAEKQCERVLPRHGDVCEVKGPLDVMDWARAKAQERDNPGSTVKREDDNCFVLAMEVLDNTPHDKVVWVDRHDNVAGSAAGAAEDLQLHEAVVEGSGADVEPYRETLRPLQDDMIKLVLRIKPELAKKIDPRVNQGGYVAALGRALKVIKPPPRSAFIPTGMASVLQALCDALGPRHNVVFADFDTLPPPQLDEKEKQACTDYYALNAPIVTSRDPVTGKHIDHPSYLHNYGNSDIFFPVDFFLLRDLHRYFLLCCDRTGQASSRSRSRVVKSTDFLRKYADTKETETRSGYNPLLEDFRNTCLYLHEVEGEGEGDRPILTAVDADQEGL